MIAPKLTLEIGSRYTQKRDNIREGQAVMLYEGLNGSTIEVLDHMLIIRRKGVASFLTQGLKGEKRIPFSSITSVQFKEPGLTSGYIQFGILGGVESRGGVLDATKDENSVLFTSKAKNEFRELRDLIESKIGRPKDLTGAHTQPRFSYSEELSRLADLRDRGALTPEEFADEKARLQAQRDSGAPATPPRPEMPPLQEPTHAEPIADVAEKPKATAGKKAGIGCLVVVGILLLLVIIGSIAGPPTKTSDAQNGSTALADATPVTQPAPDSTSTETTSDASTGSGLTASQENAVRSAEQYLNMSGFSRRGLIQQLSSEAGDGYSVDDATAAVDSLSVDWNENAAKSAKQYLDMSGFSCRELIHQLSASSGDKYTVEQATYGAHEAGAC